MVNTKRYSTSTFRITRFFFFYAILRMHHIWVQNVCMTIRLRTFYLRNWMDICKQSKETCATIAHNKIIMTK